MSFQSIKKTAAVLGWIFTAVGLIVVVASVSDWWQKLFWLACILCVALITLLFFVAGEAKEKEKEYERKLSVTPLENSCFAEDCRPINSEWIIITSPSKMYRHGCLVTIYYDGSSIPQRIGYGEVYNYDDVKQYIQIIKEFPEAEDVFDKLKNQNIEYMKHTYVMPIFFKEYTTGLK